MTRTRRVNWRDRLRSVYLWHRYAGLTVALLAIHLAVTGIVLNHAHDLGLDSHYLQSDWWLGMYGVEAPTPVSFALGDHHVSGAGDRIYWDGREVLRDAGSLHGAVALPQAVAVATADSVFLFTPDGRRIDRLEAPAPVDGVGRSADKHLVLITRRGEFAADAGLLGFHRSAAQVKPAQPTPVAATLTRTIKQSWRHHTITEERFVRDLHSGRLLGLAGPWLLDLAGILLCLLGLTGIWVWWQRRRAQRAHRR